MTSDDLRTGLATLHKRGWKKGEYGKNRGPVCMISALATETIGSCRPYLRDAIQRAYGGFWNVNSWQDQPGRKFAEVEDIFEDAIELAQMDEAMAA